MIMVTEWCFVWNLFLLLTVNCSNSKFSIHGMVTFKSAVFRSHSLLQFFRWDKPRRKRISIASVSNSIIYNCGILSISFWEVKEHYIWTIPLAPYTACYDNCYYMGLRLKFIFTVNCEIFKSKFLNLRFLYIQMS